MISEFDAAMKDWDNGVRCEGNEQCADRREFVAKRCGVSLHEAQRLIKGGEPKKACMVPTEITNPILRMAVIKALKTPRSVENLAEHVGVDPTLAESVVNDLELSGYIILRRGKQVSLGGMVQESCPRIVMANHFPTPEITIGVVADMHMCSTSERLDVLEAAYDEFAKRKITTVLCPGNYIDGEARFNAHELKVHGIADQCKYAIDHWPQRSGIRTFYVDGDDHEGWYQQREGIEFGRYLALESREHGRSDLHYLGYMEADIELKAQHGSAIIKVIHAGGGSSYAYSYSSQKLAESFQGGEKPAVALIGHYHKMEYCFPRAVHCVQAGCCQDQTRFMRKKKIAAHLGFAVVTLRLDTSGSVTHFVPEFYPFWDRNYYNLRDNAKVTRRLQNG